MNQIRHAAAVEQGLASNSSVSCRLVQSRSQASTTLCLGITVALPSCNRSFSSIPSFPEGAVCGLEPLMLMGRDGSQSHSY